MMRPNLALSLTLQSFEHRNSCDVALNRFHWLLALSAIVLASSFQALLLNRTLPRLLQNNEASVATVFDESLSTPRPLAAISAAEFCELWTGRPLTQVDCRTGRALDYLSPEALVSKDSIELMERVRVQISAHVHWLNGLNARLAERTGSERSLVRAVVALDSIIQSAGIMEGSAPTAATSHYAEAFRQLLLLEGSSYNALSGRFHVRRWDVMRMLSADSQVKVRAQRKAKALSALPLVSLFGGAAVMALGYWRAGGWGLCCTALFSCLSLLGILITADAAVNFGKGSLSYLVNPFGALLERQILITGSGHGLVALLLISAPRFPFAAVWLVRHYAWVVWAVAGTVATAYGLGSAALGAESLKIGIALLACCLLVDQGRVLHLVRKYAPRSMRLSSWPLALIRRPVGSLDAGESVISHIALPLVNFSVFGFLVIGLAALVFQDLGGALVASLMLVVALFLIFGLWPALASLLVMSVGGLVLILTDKLQGRIQLMLEPMTASISDFARLLAFSQTAQPHGYGLGNLRWCNAEGVCLPLQVLSDYTPTLLSGVGGLLSERAVFLVLVGMFFVMASRAFWQLLTHSSSQGVIVALAGFLSLACMLQTIITFFGNWRLIPLTGLGVPLVSIGISSVLTPALAVGLLLGVQFKQRIDGEPLLA
jgi:hypothetical protein